VSRNRGVHNTSVDNNNLVGYQSTPAKRYSMKRFKI
jgi:hypothetical protein